MDISKDIIDIKLDNETSEHEFKGNKIVICTYIDLIAKTELISSYVSIFFDENNDFVKGYLVAEHGLILGILDKCTNVNVLGENALDINVVLASGLWDFVCGKITNYPEIKRDIQKVVSLKREDLLGEKSIGHVLDVALSKFLAFAEGLSDVDVANMLDNDTVLLLRQEVAGLKQIFNDGMKYPKLPMRKKKELQISDENEKIQ